MSPTNKELACPHCGQNRGRNSVKPLSINRYPQDCTRRAYHCTHCQQLYETEERVVKAPIRIKVGREKFSEEKFLRFLRLFTPKRLSPEDQKLVLQNTLSVIRAAPTASGKTDSDGYLLLDRDAIARFTSRGFVMAAKGLRQDEPTRALRLDAAHVQYVLATQGTAWVDVYDFATWFRTVAHSARKQEMPSNKSARGSVDWGVPSSLRTTVEEIVKNRFQVDAEPRERVRERFEHRKLENALALALRGRDDGGSTARAIEAYVLSGVVGQRILRSSQLSTLAAEALRGVDDIAYLRWVMIGKELGMADAYEEAFALVTHPSRQIRFVFQDHTNLRTHLGLLKP